MLPQPSTSTGAKRGPKKKQRDPDTGKIIRPIDSDGNIIVQTRKPRKNKENGNYILNFFINNLFNTFLNLRYLANFLNRIPFLNFNLQKILESFLIEIFKM